MTNIAPELPPPGLEHVPEGGAVGPVQAGWRLAAREFAQNRLAVLGLAALIGCERTVARGHGVKRRAASLRQHGPRGAAVVSQRV